SCSSGPPGYSCPRCKRGISSCTCGSKTRRNHSHSRSDAMDFERELKRVASVYTDQGYQVVIHPRPEDLPPFARDFTVEIVGRRGAEGVLVAVKKDRAEMAADTDLPRYAEVIAAQPGWRFDFAILEGESPMGRGGNGVRDFSGDDIHKVLAEAE